MHQPLTSSVGAEAFNITEFAKSYRASVERARQYYEAHGVWPPDPLLDEVHAARQEILAEHGGDWRKMLDSYVEPDGTDADGSDGKERAGCDARRD